MPPNQIHSAQYDSTPSFSWDETITWESLPNPREDLLKIYTDLYGEQTAQVMVKKAFEVEKNAITIGVGPHSLENDIY